MLEARRVIQLTDDDDYTAEERRRATWRRYQQKRLSTPEGKAAYMATQRAYRLRKKAANGVVAEVQKESPTEAA